MERSRGRGIVAAAALALPVLLAGVACSGNGRTPAGPADAEPATESATWEELARAGGDATVRNTGANAFAQSAPGLDAEQRRAFVVGNNFFNDNWVTAPASTTARDGLGPMFNAQSCSSCHFKDGRAQPPSTDDPNELGLLLRLSVPGEDEHGGPLPDPVYGTQLQDHAINGVPAEGTIGITEHEISGTFEDGTAYTLVEPRYSIVDPAYGPPSPDLLISPRIAPPVFGAGLLEAIPEATILDLAEQQERAGGDVSGRPNRVWSERSGTMELGRFGWKANVASVEDQTAGAFQGDVGITSKDHRTQPCTTAQLACVDATDGGDPELSDEKLARVTFYTRTLAVPARRDVGARTTDQGSRLFASLGCAACHVPELRTGETDVAPLAEQTIRPYTDLLLHDMGPGLADGRPDFAASGSEWRTPPLWGIGLTRAVNRHTRFLHDGRARNLTEAILWHGGEATSAQKGFLTLDRDDRDALISFLESL